MDNTNIKEVVKEKYGEAALRVNTRRERLLRSDICRYRLRSGSDHLQSL